MRRLKNGEWPPYSPDLNPVEHIWPVITRTLQRDIFTSKEDLWSSLDQAFQNLPRGDIVRLYGSMQRRVAAVIAANGAHTRY